MREQQVPHVNFRRKSQHEKSVEGDPQNLHTTSVVLNSRELLNIQKLLIVLPCWVHAGMMGRGPDKNIPRSTPFNGQIPALRGGPQTQYCRILWKFPCLAISDQNYNVSIFLKIIIAEKLQSLLRNIQPQAKPVTFMAMYK